MDNQFSLIIIGSGIAGVSAAIEANAAFPMDRILLLGDEPGLPYKRTSLSKKLTQGIVSDSFTLPFFSQPLPLAISFQPATSVIALDAEKLACTLTNGQTVTAASIILATGSRPRAPTSGWQPKVLPFRTREDAIRLGEKMLPGMQLLIGGDGVLAVELACQCSMAGLRVSLAGRHEHILTRQFDPTSAGLIEDLLAQHGIRHLAGIEIDDLVLDEGKPRLAPSKTRYDLAVIAAGVLPQSQLASQAGIFSPAGIPVDEHCQTVKQGIYAAGDCSSHQSLVTALWHQAEAQGRIAGANAMAFVHHQAQRAYRMQTQRVKCRVFDCFSWSCKPDAESDASVVLAAGRRRVRILTRQGMVVGATAIDIPEELDKPLTTALRETWPIDRLRQLLMEHCPNL